MSIMREFEFFGDARSTSQATVAMPLTTKKREKHVTANGSAHPDSMYVARDENGIVMAMEETVRRALLNQPYRLIDNLPMEIAEYQLVAIRQYDVQVATKETK